MKWPDEQQMLHIRRVEKSDRWLIARVLPEFEFCFMLQRLAASHTSWNKRRIVENMLWIGMLVLRKHLRVLTHSSSKHLPISADSLHVYA